MASRLPTDDHHQHRATGHDAPPPLRLAAAIGVFVVIPLLVGGIFVVLRVLGDDGAANASKTDPAASTSASASASASEPTAPSSEPTDADTSDSDTLDEQWQRDAVKASRAGLAAMIPSTLPEAWAIESGTFDRAGMIWSMRLTSPTGPVALQQTEVAPEALVTQHLGADARPTGRLDLGKFGTGEWQVWRSPGSVAISFELESSSVVLVGADEATLESLAQTVLTAEDAPIGGLDG